MVKLEKYKSSKFGGDFFAIPITKFIQVADDNFTGKDCKLVTLSDYNHLIELAVSGDYIPENNKYTLMEWRKNPQEWSTNFEK